MKPNQQPAPEIYPGLDDELDAVYERNVADGIAKPTTEAGTAKNLGAVVQEQLEQTPDILQPTSVRPEVLREWALPALQAASESWNKYFNALGSPEEMPKQASVVEDLGFKHPNFYPTLERLYNAKRALIDAKEVNPANESVADSMMLVLIPWGEFSVESDNLENFINRLRNSQPDYFNEHIIKAIRENKPFYRDPSDPSKLLTVNEYLALKISQDGPWGVMLAQTSKEAGVNRLKGQSPNQLTNSGVSHLDIAGVPVDAMGIFEWLALTLQEDASKLSNDDYSWLLANRLEVNGAPYVPYGGWYRDQVRSYLDGADNTNDDMRPRLAVS